MSLASHSTGNRVAITLSLVFAALAANPADAQNSPAPPLPAAAETSDAKPDGNAKRERRARRQAVESTATAEPTAAAAIQAGGAVPRPIVLTESERECRSVRITGTRVPKRVCASPEQWAAEDARGEEGARELRDHIDEQASRPVPESQYTMPPNPAIP